MHKKWVENQNIKYKTQSHQLATHTLQNLHTSPPVKYPSHNHHKKLYTCTLTFQSHTLCLKVHLQCGYQRSHHTDVDGIPIPGTICWYVLWLNIFRASPLVLWLTYIQMNNKSNKLYRYVQNSNVFVLLFYIVFIIAMINLYRGPMSFVLIEDFEASRERTSHSFNKNQPMHRRRKFLKEKFNENARK